MSKHNTVLVVDDDEDGLLLLQLAFTEAGISNPIQTLRNGFEAIDYLKGDGPYSDRAKYPLPCFMLLDLKMPSCSGFEVLAWRQTQKNLQRFPIIVFSSSNLQPDIQRAMELGATAYSVKPLDFNNLVTMAKEFRKQWLEPDTKPRPVLRDI